LVAAALHAGHDLRAEVADVIALDDATRRGAVPRRRVDQRVRASGVGHAATRARMPWG
jgi:hypothetical protein